MCVCDMLKSLLSSAFDFFFFFFLVEDFTISFCFFPSSVCVCGGARMRAGVRVCVRVRACYFFQSGQPDVHVHQVVRGCGTEIVDARGGQGLRASLGGVTRGHPKLMVYH